MPRTRSLVYRNWLGLMRGDPRPPAFEKAGHTVERRLEPGPRLHGNLAGGTLTAARAQP